MSLTFTKLFSSITESTVWSEPAHTRLVWITMLAMADRNGRIWASVPGLAHRARVPLEDAEKALATFLAPDRHSRTVDFDGRRIEAIDGGWRLLNYAKYRAIRDQETTREVARDHMRRKRAAANGATVDAKGEQLIAVDRRSHNAEAEAEAEAEEKKKNHRARGALPALDPRPDWLPKEWDDYEQHRAAAKKGTWTELARRKALGQLERWNAEGYDLAAIINAAIAAGWTGLFARREFKKANWSATSATSRAAVDAFVGKGDASH